MNNTAPPRIVFAGDRDIAVWVLQFLLDNHVEPLALLVPEPWHASHAAELASLCSFLPAERILRGTAFRKQAGISLLKALDIDFIVGVHYPYIVPSSVLSIPRHGVLNLHPAYLPYNRGWHTPSWAILEGTPAGATLHFMDEGVDTGDIVHQKLLEVSPADTADTLYQRLKRLELETFKEAWAHLASGVYHRRSQKMSEGTFHRRQELLQPSMQRIDLDESVKAVDLLTRLRALTTSKTNESAYFEVDGKRYRVQVKLWEERKDDPSQ